MLVFPNCKINLGLHILGKRDDGFHNLETVFYPIPIKDALEIIPNPAPTTAIQFTNTGMVAEEKEENNICIKAYWLLKKDFPQLPAVKIHLHKSIPIGAGLGGGSADAAYTLKLLNEQFHLHLSPEKLMAYAAQLGSDCAFFIMNQPCIASERGEILEAIKIDLSDYRIVLINPGIHVNTGWAFSQLTGFSGAGILKQAVQQPVSTWKDNLKNDFEIPVFKEYPGIESIKKELYLQGAVYAAMSGSGSSVFGLFEKNRLIPTKFFADYFVRILAF